MKKIHVSSIQVMHWASEKNGAKNSNFQIPIQIYIYIYFWNEEDTYAYVSI